MPPSSPAQKANRLVVQKASVISYKQLSLYCLDCLQDYARDDDQGRTAEGQSVDIEHTGCDDRDQAYNYQTAGTDEDNIGQNA